MAGKSNDESYGPFEMDRRTLAKLAGMSGISLISSGSVSGLAAANPDNPTILMNVKPLRDRALIQVVESEDRTASGIIAQGGRDDDAVREGIVRATGDGAVGDDGEPIPLEVEGGDKVLFTGSGTEVTIAGEEHLIMREGQIIAIVDD